MGEFGDIFIELGLAGLERVELSPFERHSGGKTGYSRKEAEKECGGFHLMNLGAGSTEDGRTMRSTALISATADPGANTEHQSKFFGVVNSMYAIHTPCVSFLVT